MAIEDMSKGEAVREIVRLDRLVRDRDVTIGNLQAEIRRLSPKVAGPSVLSPADELVHLRKERVRLEGIAKDRAIALAAVRRERDALPTIASVFEVGSPAFHAVWTALQQFVDNRDDSEEGEARAGESEVTVVERAIEEMNAAFAKHTEKLSDNA